MATNNNPTFVITGRARLSYIHLFQPYAHQPGQEPKYSTTILIPKSDIATKQKIDVAIHAATEQGVSKTWSGARPPMLAIPIHDGDGVRPNGDPFGDECKGHWVFTASSKQPPQVVDYNNGLSPIVNQSEVYSGMYAFVSINFFPYANSGKRGIGCGLNNVCKVAEGEPLGGRTNAADDFASLQASMPPQQQSPVYQQPMQQQAYQQQYQQSPVQQPIYAPQPQQASQIDPITGLPISGGVMGI